MEEYNNVIHLTDEKLRIIMNDYINHRRIVYEKENNPDNLGILYKDSEYNFHLGSSRMAEKIMKILGILPQNFDIMQYRDLLENDDIIY